MSVFIQVFIIYFNKVFCQCGTTTVTKNDLNMVRCEQTISISITGSD